MFGIGNRPCYGCGQSVRMQWDPQFRVNVCSQCLTVEGYRIPVPVAQGGPRQLVRVYDIYKIHGNVMKAFQQEAALLARAGWMVTSQAPGAMITANFKRQLANLTVTYTRQ